MTNVLIQILHSNLFSILSFYPSKMQEKSLPERDVCIYSAKRPPETGGLGGKGII